MKIQEKMVALGRAKMWLGGWQELSRKIKRFHVRCLPVIYHMTGIMFGYVGIIIFRDMVEMTTESDAAGWQVTLFLAIYLILLMYWTIRIMSCRKKK